MLATGGVISYNGEWATHTFVGNGGAFTALADVEVQISTFTEKINRTYKRQLLREEQIVLNRNVYFANAVLSTAQKKFGNNSLYLNSTPLILTNSSDYDLVTNNFTWDWWEYRTGTNVCSSIKRDATPTNQAFLLGYGTGTTTEVYMSSQGGSAWDIASGKILSSTSILNTLNHFAVVRSGNTFYTFKNGVQQATWSSSLSLAIGAGGLDLGGGWPTDATNLYQGYIDELRLSSIARWTANFTPPTEPHVNDEYTKLLYHAEPETFKVRYRLIQPKIFAVPSLSVVGNSFQFGSSL